MSSERKAIRLAVATLLTGKTAAGSRVFTSRSDPLFMDELPCLLVYTKSDSGQILENAPRNYQRTLTLGIELVTDTGTNLPDAADDLADAVEQLIYADKSLGGQVEDTVYKSTECEEGAKGEKLVAACRLLFDVTYTKLAPGDVSGTLSNFGSVDLTVDTAPADETAEIHNQFDVPQTQQGGTP